MGFLHNTRGAVAGVIRSYSALFFALIHALRTARVRALLLLCLLIALAQTLVFMRLEGWSFIDGFYFSVVSMATVGYGDLTPTSPMGKIAAIAFLGVGIGIFVLTVSSIAEAILRQLRQDETFGINPNRNRKPGE